MSKLPLRAMLTLQWGTLKAPYRLNLLRLDRLKYRTGQAGKFSIHG